MSDNQWWYFRASIDIGTQDEALAKALRREKGGQLRDEPLARELFESVRAGKTELDGIAEIEDHGGTG